MEEWRERVEKSGRVEREDRKEWKSGERGWKRVEEWRERIEKSGRVEREGGKEWKSGERG